MGSDAELLAFVTSANVACGFHAGDPAVMDRTVGLAVRAGVALGAHPGHADLRGFGRRPIQAAEDETVARAIVRGVARAGRELILVGLASTEPMRRAAQAEGLRFAAEAFAD